MTDERVRVGDATVGFLHVDADSPYAVVEWAIPAGGLGTPVHVHEETDETFYVLEGVFGFLVGDDTSSLSTGGFVRVRKRTPHAFWNDGNTAARLLMTIAPPEFVGYFRELASGLSTAASPQETAKLRERLSSRHDVEILGPPPDERRGASDRTTVRDHS